MAITIFCNWCKQYIPFDESKFERIEDKVRCRDCKEDFDNWLEVYTPIHEAALKMFSK